MKGGDFIRKVEKIGRDRNVPVRFEKSRGKGSHGTLYYGNRFTIVAGRKKEIRAGTLAAMIQQLGFTKKDFR